MNLTDGTTPGVSATTQTTSQSVGNISSGTTIKAFAAEEGWVNSDIETIIT